MNVNQLKNLHKLSIHCVIFDKVKTLANMSNQISINTKIEFAPLAKSVKSYYRQKKPPKTQRFDTFIVFTSFNSW